MIQSSVYSFPLFTGRSTGWRGTRKRGSPVRGPQGLRTVAITRCQLEPGEADKHRHDRGWRQKPWTWLVGQVWAGGKGSQGEAQVLGTSDSGGRGWGILIGKTRSRGKVRNSVGSCCFGCLGRQLQEGLGCGEVACLYAKARVRAHPAWRRLEKGNRSGQRRTCSKMRTRRSRWTWQSCSGTSDLMERVENWGQKSGLRGCGSMWKVWP